MSRKQRPPRAAGSYSMGSVLRHPSRVFKRPPRAASEADLAAVRGGQVRRVACFLAGSYPPFPPRFRQGWLDLSKDDAQWKPLFNRLIPAQHLTEPIESVRTHPANVRDPSLPKGAPDRVMFTVVSCQTPSGRIDLVVSRWDVPLVVGYFSPADQPASPAE
jgi:hypothetical protein